MSGSLGDERIRGAVRASRFFCDFGTNLLTFFAETLMIIVGLLCKIDKRGRPMIDGFVTVKDMAKRWGVTVRTVQTMCSEGKIEGATKFGDIWAIPRDAVKPTDSRVTTGKYKN